MSIGVVVQARMGSSRLPGKVLMMINGHPMLWYLIQTVKSKTSNFIIATSVNREDDAIEEYCLSIGVEVFRGSQLNVAERFYKIAQEKKWEAFVRLNGDSPLFDGCLLELSIRLFQENEVDLVTNTAKRSFPKGQSVEVVKTETFLKSYYDFQYESDFEHVTQYFYRNRDQYNILNFESDGDYSGTQLSVDTWEDFKRAEALISECSEKIGAFDWKYLYESIVRRESI